MAALRARRGARSTMTRPTAAAMAAPPNTISPSQRTVVGLIRSAPKALNAKTEPMPPATDSPIPTT